MTKRERRSSLRYPANKEVLLRWEKGEEVHGRLENISLGGASIQAETAPPECGTIFVCINEDPQLPWTEATIIKVTKVRGWFRRELYRIQVKFIGSCPYDFFTGVITDFAAKSSIPMTPDYESYWR